MSSEVYYTPYISDSDSDTGSESDKASTGSSESSGSFETDSSSSEYAALVAAADVPRDFRALAQGLSFGGLAGPPFDTSGELVAFNAGANSAGAAGFATFSNYAVPADASGAKITIEEKSINNIIMLDSRDRDKKVYPQPTAVTLRLPRTYTNVTDFQLVQVKLLSAFLYFRNTKHNTDISIQELNRTSTDICGNVTPAVIKNYIREGSYNIDGLLAELTTQLNRTPLFYDFPNGFQDFAPQFAATGNFALGFNFPGDTYYDSLLDQYIPSPTTTLIVSKYFQSQYAGLSSYSVDQIKVAYYYPVLKEALLDTRYDQSVNLEIPPEVAAYLLPTETVYSRCIYTFQGINDPVIQQVIQQNLPVLEDYRNKHTFRFSLINRYTATYESQNNNVTISAPGLNTSLSNLISYKQSQFFAEQLNNAGITEAQYNFFQSQNTLLLAVLNDMFYYIERYLASIFGVNFNTYTLNYIATPSNVVPVQNAIQATGVSSNFDLAVLSRTAAPIDSNILLSLRQDAPRFWPRLSNLPESTIAFPYNLETGSSATSSNYVYSLFLDQQIREFPFIDASGGMYTNRITRSADVVVPLEATKYTVFRFKSGVRQTLEVETLPRPTKYRYPAYNAVAYDLSHQVLFDNSYSFVETAQNVAMDITSNFSTTGILGIPGFYPTAPASNFGISAASSIALWGGSNVFVTVGATSNYFQFVAPVPAGAPAAPGYRYPLSFALSPAANNSTFVTPISAFLYHDRGAFMADISDNRNEKPLHYLSSVTASTTTSTLSFTFPVYAGQKYYMITRSQLATPATQHYQVAPWFPEGLSYTALSSSLAGFDPLADPMTATALSNFNYAAVNDPAYVRLPVQSSIQTKPETSALYTLSTFSTVAMGYDASGVSTDLTAYCGYTAGATNSNGYPAATYRIDPVNQFVFQVGAGYNSTTQTYTAAGSSNTLLRPEAAGTYQPKALPAQRETTVAHWYGTTYLPNSENQAPLLSSFIADTTAITPFTPSTTGGTPLTGYIYGGSNQSLQLGDGVCGISLLPQEGVWDIQRTMFKSVYTTDNPSINTNLKIARVGVFPSAQARLTPFGDYRLSNAVAVLRASRATVYSPSTQSLGFDAAGGTYHEFVRDTEYRTGPGSYLYGYTQTRSTINTDINAIYTLMPFDSNDNPMMYQGLVGSAVPYPFYSDAVAAAAYNDGSVSPAGQDLVVPQTKSSPDVHRGPPAGYDETQSKYEQSMTIGTNHVQYVVPYPFVTTSTAMRAWGPFPTTPSLVIADASGYFLTQDGFYRVYSYPTEEAAITTSSFTERYQFTLDQVYPPGDPLINFIGVAASETEYAFFAYSNAEPAAPTTSKLLIRTMRPADGTVTQAYEYQNLPGFDPQAQEITSWSYNNFGGFTLGLKAPSSFTALCKHNSYSSTITFFSTLAVAGANSTIDQLKVCQATKESDGLFYVFPHRAGITGLGYATAGYNDYVKVQPAAVAVTPNPNYTYQAFTGAQNTWGGPSPTPVEIQTFSLSNAPAQPALYSEVILVKNPYLDRIFLLSEYDNTHFYEVTRFTGSNRPAYTSNASTTMSAFEFPAAASNLTTGANGSKWSLFNSTLYGNRDNTVDGPRGVATAWQIFYPVQRSVLRQVRKDFTNIHDLSGLQYPEYPHTALIGYNSLSSLQADIGSRWGLESSGNFVVADFRQRGQIFNSYLFTFPLTPNSSGSPYYYLAVRNYSPTEKSQVLMRFALPNQYDFGYVSMADLSNEIVLSQTASNQYNPEYWSALNTFNAPFIIDSNGRVFGSNIVDGFVGSNISSVTGFGDFYSRFKAIYTQYNSQVQLIQTINSNTAAATSNFIKTDLQYILPASALNRQRFTDPLTFSILWLSSLTPQYRNLEDNWGLGWNLGFAKRNTPYETVQRADSFYKILDDYISLRLNPEFDFNRMDTGAKENLELTLDATGNIKAVHAKLLLANFGSFAQTIITNPIRFTPPLLKLDRLRFEWVDATGAVIDNNDCEWNMVVQAAEKKELAVLPKALHIDPTTRTRVG